MKKENVDQKYPRKTIIFLAWIIFCIVVGFFLMLIFQRISADNMIVSFLKNSLSFSSHLMGEPAKAVSCSQDPNDPNNPPGYGNSCASSPSSCGMTNAGTIQCNGTCDAPAPSDSLCPVCGNSVCENTIGENCSTCPQDCGGCGSGVIPPPPIIVSPNSNHSIIQGENVFFDGLVPGGAPITFLDFEWREGGCHTGALLSTNNSFNKNDFSLGTHIIYLRDRIASEPGWSTNCPFVRLSVFPRTPVAPTSLTTTCNIAGDQVTLDWDNVPQASHYNIKLNNTSNDDPACSDEWSCTTDTPPDQSTDNHPSHSITYNITPGTLYTAMVQSENITGAHNPISETFTCAPATLKICEGSCNSAIQHPDGTTISMYDTDAPKNFYACYSRASGCNDSDPAANITSLASWLESGQDAITLSGASPKILSPNPIAAPGSHMEQITASYGILSSSLDVNVSVIKFCDSGCTPDEDVSVCIDDSYTATSPTLGCGSIISTCDGTRLCDFNWKEAAP